MTTISTTVLPEEEVVVEEVEPAGDVAAELVGREELPATSVLLVGVVSGEGVALFNSNVVLVGVDIADGEALSISKAVYVKADSPHPSSTVLPSSKEYMPAEGSDSGLLVTRLSVRPQEG